MCYIVYYISVRLVKATSSASETKVEELWMYRLQYDMSTDINTKSKNISREVRKANVTKNLHNKQHP
jgi:hypothetical protein